MTGQILFKRNLPNAKIPHRGSDEAAGFDLHAASIEIDEARNCLIIDTGLSTAFEPGYGLFLFARSGLASKHGLRLVNGVGVIDADYRGPLKVMLTSSLMSAAQITTLIYIGDRICQAVLLPVPLTTWVEVNELPDSLRGHGGFGSTGTR